MQAIFVLTWSYADGSGYGVLGSWSDPNRAVAMLNLVKKAAEDGGRKFCLIETQLDL